MSFNARVSLLVVVLCVAIVGCGGLVGWLFDADRIGPSVGLTTRDPSIPGLPDVQCSTLLRGDLELRMCAHQSPEEPVCQCTLEVWNLSDEVRRFDRYPQNHEPSWDAFEIPPSDGVLLTGGACLERPIRDTWGMQCSYSHKQAYTVSVLVPSEGSRGG